VGREERDTQGGHRRRDPLELRRIDLVEDLGHDLGSRRLHVFERLATDGRDSDEDDPAILGNPDALHEAAFLDPIDEPGGSGIGHVQHLREPAHRDLTVPLEQVHDVQLGHADAETDEALAADTLELSERGPEVGQDRRLRLVRGHASYHAKYHSDANDTVNIDYRRAVEDQMRFALMLESQQGLSYADHVAIAKRAEANGFETLFRSDHFQSFPGPSGKPTTDAWSIMAGLARDTDRIGLGVLVSPVTFRHPGTFAKVVTTVDEMSGGRIEVGVGAGWNELEHRQLGLAFPPIRDRADLLEDQLAILHGLWGEPDGWSYDGHQVSIRDAEFHPKPVDVPGRPRTATGGARPRILVGGQGSPRSYRLAAHYADEFNLSSSDPAKAVEAFAALDRACTEIGRDPGTLARSTMCGVLIGRDREEMDRRIAAVVPASDAEQDATWFEDRLGRWIAGTPDEAQAMVRRFAEAGVERIMLQDFLPWDLDMIDVMGEVLVGQV
jgi:alkanesulfonate monooxygenase SsuD/methylene tetrahydromethanopterin reductase-like flavin-dependent oxidoreductase (luciferase family)